MQNNKIKNLINKINKINNKQIAFSADETAQIEGVTSGVDSLDYAIGCNGYPVGRITEIFGLPGSAKTSLALYGIAQAQKLGKICMFIDAEFALDIELARGLGVDVDNLILIKPDSGEQAFEVIENMISDVDYIVVDSIPSLVPTPEIEAEINKPTMGGQARLIASGLRRLVPLVAKNNTVLILINQQRVNIMGGQYDPYTTPGGLSLRFYASVRMEVKVIEKIKVNNEIVGQRCRFKMRKNKVGMNNDEGTFDLIFNEGFSSQLDIVSVATKKGVLRRQGNTYYFGEQKLATGKEKVMEYLQANPELQSQVLAECQQ